MSFFLFNGLVMTENNFSPSSFSTTLRIYTYSVLVCKLIHQMKDFRWVHFTFGTCYILFNLAILCHVLNRIFCFIIMSINLNDTTIRKKFLQLKSWISIFNWPCTIKIFLWGTSRCCTAQLHPIITMVLRKNRILERGSLWMKFIMDDNTDMVNASRDAQFTFKSLGWKIAKALEIINFVSNSISFTCIMSVRTWLPALSPDVLKMHILTRCALRSCRAVSSDNWFMA